MNESDPRTEEEAAFVDSLSDLLTHQHDTGDMNVDGLYTLRHGSDTPDWDVYIIQMPKPADEK
jgi:hypothetical protein